MNNHRLQLFAVLFCFLAVPYSTAVLAVATDVTLNVVDPTNEGVDVVELTLIPKEGDEVTVENDDEDNKVAVSLEEGDTYTVEVTDADGNKHHGKFKVPPGGGRVFVNVRPVAPPDDRDNVSLYVGVANMSTDVLDEVAEKSRRGFIETFPSATDELSSDDDSVSYEIGVEIPLPSFIRDRIGAFVSKIRASYFDPEFSTSETFTFPGNRQFIGDRKLDVSGFKLGVVLARRLGGAWSGEAIVGASFNRAKTTFNSRFVVNGQIVDTFNDRVTKNSVSPFVGLGIVYDFNPGQSGGLSAGVDAQWSELEIEDPIITGRTFEDDAVSIGLSLRYMFPVK